MSRPLLDRPIIITGSSSGIGAATAIAAARAGMNVVLNARRQDRLEAVADEVRRLGRRAVVIPGDVTEECMSTRLLDGCIEHFGGVDVVFANAGIGLEVGMIDCDEDRLREIFDVNFFAGVDLCRRAAEVLLRGGKPGHLLMCSSCMSKFTLARYGAYSATKAAQNHVCRAMNLELRRHGIHVSSVLPITTATEFHSETALRSGRSPRHAVRPDHASRLFVQSSEKVARAVIRCLERPRPEVWTSHIVRATAAVGTMFPRFMDWAVAKR